MNGRSMAETEMQTRTHVIEGADGRFYEFTLKSEDIRLLDRISAELGRNQAYALFDYVQTCVGTRRLSIRVADSEGGPWTAVTDDDYIKNRMFQHDISPPTADVAVEGTRITATPSRAAAPQPTTRPAEVAEQAPLERHMYAVRVGSDTYVFSFEGDRPRDWADLVARQDHLIGAISHYVNGSYVGVMQTDIALEQMYRRIREAQEARGSESVRIEMLS